MRENQYFSQLHRLLQNHLNDNPHTFLKTAPLLASILFAATVTEVGSLLHSKMTHPRNKGLAYCSVKYAILHLSKDEN